jgi:uncharacterized protein YydD (DUF2326 family)
MKLSRLYSNQPAVFESIEFRDGLCAVLAEIRVPANRLLDTHNLGKTTVGELIDYCLLKGKSKDFFLFKHEARFAEFTFYLEIQLPTGEYLTIARPVVPGSRVDLMRSETSIPDVTAMGDAEWNHVGLPFVRARVLLDGIIGIDALKPWGFRKLVGYLIRSQSDYMDVFQLGKFSGKHQDWKPFVALLVGLEAQPVIDLYDKREELNTAETRLSTLTREWGGDDVDASVIDGLISVKRRDIAAKTEVLDSFSFGEEDQRVTATVVQDTEVRIAALNEESYKIAQLSERIDESLKDQQVVFKPSDAEALFREAGVAFGDQLKRDYEQLIAFNRAITKERREALEEQRHEIAARLSDIEDELATKNSERARSLGFLRESDSLVKYKELSRELSGLQAELNTLEARRAAASRLIELRREQRVLSQEYGHLETLVESQIEAVSKNDESRFGHLRRYFTEIIFDVLGQNAIIAIRMNKAGGLEFTAEFIGDSGTATSGDRGTSYKKLMCIAFDLAMLRTYLDVPFPRFVYHDGALEQLDPRKREKLIGVFRQYAELGLQPIISLLDSDLPLPLGSGKTTLDSTEVVATLHDEGEDGRLFVMPAW